jgi:hypothetical protein
LIFSGDWKLVVSVVKPVRARTFLATLSALVVVAGMLFGANVASADSVQYQSYERPNQTEACAAPVGETPWQASWGTDSSWYPSWEQWANNGTGGWTCGRSITWAKTPVAGGTSSARTYALGDIGPGGGLVFLISGGLTYEMAPKTWSGSSSDDTPLLTWCDGFTDVPTAIGTAIGTGAANTAAMAASVACSSNAAAAVLAYAPAGTTAGQWFLPSKDELNAMCNYSRTWTGTPSTGVCTGAQNGSFASSTYGFDSLYYWDSSQNNRFFAWVQDFTDGEQFDAGKFSTLRVRPVRAF